MKKNPAELLLLARNALLKAGANPVMAKAAANHLLRAEEHGLPTHGMSRVPFYCGFLRNNRADGAARPKMLADRAAVCLIDNCDGLPYESAEWAIGEVIQRARRNGIGFAGITNSAHVGVLGIHLLPVAAAGMVGVAFTNSPAAIPAWGGKKALFGTDPVAFAFPRESGDPLVIDLALTTVVRGKIMMAMQKGEKIPEGWALAFELICAALTGAAIGTEADSFFADKGNKPKIGHAFLAIDPGALAGHDRYFERVETVITTMLADEGVRLPGSRRFASEKKVRNEGIEIADDLLAKIEQLAAA